MTDVRLTAVNPEDSQVYPVACNDKGELLLESTDGNFDVPGNLTVGPGPGATISSDGSATFAGIVQSADFDSESDNGFGYKLHKAGQIESQRASGTSQSVFRGYSGSIVTADILSDGSARFAGDLVNIYDTGYFRCQRATGSDISLNGGSTNAWQVSYAGNTTSTISHDGSASFAGPVNVGNSFDTGSGVQAFPGGSLYLRQDGASSSNRLLVVLNSSDTANPVAQVNGDGSANFKGQVTLDGDRLELLVSSASDTAWRALQGGAVKASVLGDGSATFSGNVTAPNINFKLAPATVAAMPAPLIDDGFAANNEVDLLSLLMEMKLQIRDLNAFMQRSIQDEPET